MNMLEDNLHIWKKKQNLIVKGSLISHMDSEWYPVFRLDLRCIFYQLI